MMASNRSKSARVLLLAAILLAGVMPTVAVRAAGPSDFDRVVKPFLTKHCIKCHGTNKPKGKVTFHNVSNDFDREAVVEQWIAVLDQLTFKEMPPPKEKAQPTALATAKIVDWIKQRLDDTGKAEAYRQKLLAPQYGNWVSHEKLFSGEIKTLPFSPSRLWRLSPDIFNKQGFHRARSPFTFVTRKNGIRDYASMSGVDQSTVKMILINTGQLLDHREKRGEFKRFADDQPTPADKLLEDAVRNEFRFIVKRLPSEQEQAKYVTFLKQNMKAGGNLEGLKTTIKAMFLSPEAIYRYEFGLGKADEHGRRHLSSEELAYALAYALTDRGPDHTDAIKKAYADGKLTSKEDVALVVAQMLVEEPPKGNWSNPRLPRIQRFFDEFFGFDRAGDVFKDNQRRGREGIRQWNPAIMIYDARMIIEYHLKKDQDFIAELLTTNQYFVAHPGDNEYAREFYDQRVAEYTAKDYVASQIAKKKKSLEKEFKDFSFTPEQIEKRLASENATIERGIRGFKLTLEAGMNPLPRFPFSRRSRGLSDLLYIVPYNLPATGSTEQQKWNWPIEQPFAMPKEQRAGLLTHPAWLAAHSLNDGNDPIHRGVWVREKLLAGVIQDVPPDVDAQVPTDPHRTLRERMEVVRAERCWACHRKMNPLGETFEVFDDWGRYRTHVYFDENKELVTRRDGTFDRMLKDGKLTARKIDATGAITGSGDPKVDGDVENAIAMIHRLGKSSRARQSFIRHLFRYFMGRNEMLSDSKTLVEAENAYLKEGGSFKALVVSLLSSDSFLYRR